MSLAHSPRIVTDGLVLCLDAGNTKSYPGSGSSIVDISGNGVIATLSNYTPITSPYPGIKLNDDTGRINLSTITNITTVELWFYQNVNTGNRYLLDMRTGGGGGWIYQASVGGNWSGGKLYINGQFIENIGNSVISTIENYTYQKYAQVVVIANTPATDDMNLFSRYSNNESIDVNFYSAKVYNKALTASEIQQNFNALRGRFGI